MDNSSGVNHGIQRMVFEIRTRAKCICFLLYLLEVKRASSLLSENTGTVMR